MARLAISKDYFPAYAKLPRKAQRKADEFLSKFEKDSTAAAIHLEPIQRTLDPQLRSARIGDDYRVILRAPEKGDVFLVLWADHHDEAYRWAATKQTAVHPTTGTLQIFDAIKASQVVETVDPAAAAEPPALPQAAPTLFHDKSDDDLFLSGVPRPLLPSVRSLQSEEDLDRLLPHLPPEAAEVLTGLAAGLTLDEAIEEVFGRTKPPSGAPPPPTHDVHDVPAALEREGTQRQFRLIGEDLDLDAALKHPLDMWRVFLHPRQKRVAHARTKGPVRVLGGAGTGKTVVALHRAAFLVREVYKKPDDRVLFTTFTVNLAEDLRVQLAKLLEPDDLARVEVVNIDAWASQYLRSRGRSVRPAFDKDQQDQFRMAVEVYGEDAFSYDFYWAEWRDVVQDQNLQTLDEYLTAVRRRRGVPLSRADRRRVWPVFTAYREGLKDAGMLEPVEILRAARAELELAGGTSRYRSVVVDETQDFSVEGLKLVRAIAGPEHPDDLFLVGDAHQRIYGHRVSLSACGIQVRGRRSQTLRLNYRTTGAICRYATRILDGLDVDDLDEGKADPRGYVSLREGPTPEVHVFPDDPAEERAVVDTVRSVMEAGTPPESICIIARTRGPLADRFAPALARAGIPHVILEQHEPRSAGVRLATMHRVKGLEFAVTLLVDVSKGSVPAPTSELRSEDPIVAGAALARERSLLYVAASRARDDLYVFASGALSPLLGSVPVKARAESKPPPPAPPKDRQPEVRLTPPPVAAQTEEQLLTTPLALLDLPTRMVNWADRTGVRTLGELARRHPADLVAERNLGRTSIAQTRKLIERITGKKWEQLAGGPTSTPAALSVPLPDRFAQAVAAEDWDLLRVALAEEQRLFLLSAMDLPARVVSFAEMKNLKTLGQLAELSRGDLDAASNLGRASIRELVRRVAARVERIRRDAELAETGLFESLKSLVEDLKPVDRMVVTRRSGLGGDSQTLQEVGDTLGFSRERARQIEARACGDLARRPWAEALRARVREATREGGAPLTELGTDPWWRVASRRASVVRFVVEDVLETAHLVEIDGEPWVTRHSDDEIEAASETIRALLESLALPCTVDSVRSRVGSITERFGARIAAELWADVEDILQIDQKDGKAIVAAIGSTRRAEVLAILRSSDRPLSLDELTERMGRRVRLPDEIIYFKRGTIGLKEHFPDFDGWAARLVPKAEAIVREQDADRQWSCAELLDELREQEDIPDWLTPWGLAALVRAGSKLQYLGRLRVALPGNPENDSRILVHDELERLLTETGGPMTREELTARILERLAVTELGLQQVFGRPQFLRLDGQRYGLLERDVPGGPGAVADALDHVEGVLARRNRGMSVHHIHSEVMTLSEAHAEWTEELVHSLLRADGRFRTVVGGGVGLSEWESTRFPTRLELVRSALEDSDGRVSVDALMERIKANYGEPPTRASLAGVAMKLGASLEGEWMVRRGPIG